MRALRTKGDGRRGLGGRWVGGVGTVRLSDLVSVSRTLLIRSKIVQCTSVCVD